MARDRKESTSPAPAGTDGTEGTDSTDSTDGIDDEGHTYEQARDELADVVAKLEAGGLTLDQSLNLWERGEYLARACHRFLDGARERVDAALAVADQQPEPAGDS